MSAHSTYHDWKPGDELPPGFVEEVAQCVYDNQRVGGPLCFAILCPADRLIWMIWFSELPPTVDSPWHDAYTAVLQQLFKLRAERHD